MVWDERWQERTKRGLSMRLQTPPKVEKLRKALHAKAKAEPEFRFYVLYDKVYREDLVAHGYALCRANGGAAGVDGETFEAIESRGREAWLGELTQQLRDKRYRKAVIQGIPCSQAELIAQSGSGFSVQVGVGWGSRRVCGAAAIALSG